jgi:hypothetical protein
MTSYFDERMRLSGDSLEKAEEIEREVSGHTQKIIEDPDFPRDLRQEAEEILLSGLEARCHCGHVKNDHVDGKARCMICSAPQNGGCQEFNNEGLEWYNSVSYSQLVSDLHSLFHKLGSRRVSARFGVWSDNPLVNLTMMKEAELKDD